MDTRTVDVEGARLCVRSWGDDGVPLVFWHALGLGGNGSALDVAAPALVDAGYRPLALDAPGFGLSAALPRDRYAVDRLAGLLWALADALALDDPILAGHSWGGTVAITAAARQPRRVRALVLLDSGHLDYADVPGSNPEATVDDLTAELDREPMPATWDELVALLAESGLDQPWTLETWREAFDVASDGTVLRRVSSEVMAASRFGLMQARATDAWPAVAAAGIPTLVLLATDPEPTRELNEAWAARMRDAVPSAELRFVDGMRHAVFADLGPRLGPLLAEWLAGRLAP